MKRGKNKKAIEIEMLGWWLIAIGVLIVMITAYYFLYSDVGTDTLNYIKNLLRFWRT